MDENNKIQEQLPNNADRDDNIDIVSTQNVEENFDIIQHDSFNIDEYLREIYTHGGSDIHLHADEHPIYRKNGKIFKSTNYPKITEEKIIESIREILPEKSMSDIFENKLKTSNDFDFCYEIENVARFRVNVCERMYKKGLVIRTIPYEPIPLNKLYLPPAVAKLAEFNNGLILVTGPTGSGKSTTLASLINLINETQQKHIISLEDPVEFSYKNKKCIITQRQVEIDTESFSTGVKYALRQDPDVILIGEIRDLETLDAALKAAETGHLVLSTLHTNDAVQTINRIINMYAPEQRPFLRQQLAATLRATIAQKLLPTVDGTSRRAACEFLVVTPTIQDLIIKEEIESIYELVKNGSFNNMITMNMSLYQLYKAGIITATTAIEASDKKNELQQMLRGMYHGVQREH